jgi:hypothetical protein
LFFRGLGGLWRSRRCSGRLQRVVVCATGAARLPATFVAASLTTVAVSLPTRCASVARNDRVLVELLGGGRSPSRSRRSGARGSAPGLVALYRLSSQPRRFSPTTGRSSAIFQYLRQAPVPLFTVGLSLGGAFGGVTAMGVVSALSAEALLVGWALGLLAAAALVLGSRARLQRWRVLASGEEDETSVAGIRAACATCARRRSAVA